LTGGRLSRELADRFEDNLEVLVVLTELLFHFFKLGSQVSVRG
jgi:hypothetical protein